MTLCITPMHDKHYSSPLFNETTANFIRCQNITNTYTRAFSLYQRGKGLTACAAE